MARKEPKRREPHWRSNCRNTYSRHSPRTCSARPAVVGEGGGGRGHRPYGTAGGAREGHHKLAGGGEDEVGGHEPPELSPEHDALRRQNPRRVTPSRRRLRPRAGSATATTRGGASGARSLAGATLCACMPVQRCSNSGRVPPGRCGECPQPGLAARALRAAAAHRQSGERRDCHEPLGHRRVRKACGRHLSSVLSDLILESYPGARPAYHRELPFVHRKPSPVARTRGRRGSHQRLKQLSPQCTPTPHTAEDDTRRALGSVRLVRPGLIFENLYFPYFFELFSPRYVPKRGGGTYYCALRHPSAWQSARLCAKALELLSSAHGEALTKAVLCVSALQPQVRCAGACAAGVGPATA